MNIFIKILPVILIAFIFYVMIGVIKPSYQETISLTKRLNELNNKKAELESLEKLIRNLEDDPNLQQLLTQRNTLNVWLPQAPNIEELVYTLDGLHKSLGLNFLGTDFKLEGEMKVNPKVLPVKKIKFQLSLNLPPELINQFIAGIEKNARLMVIKSIILKKNGKSDLDVESYFLPKNND